MKKGYDFSNSKKLDFKKFKDCQIKLASTKKVDEFRGAIDKILKMVKFPEALVTDLSCFGDFALDEKAYKVMSKKLGIEIKVNTLLVDVASKIVRQ